MINIKSKDVVFTDIISSYKSTIVKAIDEYKKRNSFFIVNVTNIQKLFNPQNIFVTKLKEFSHDF